jgi:hypothetical protein
MALRFGMNMTLDIGGVVAPCVRAAANPSYSPELNHMQGACACNASTKELFTSQIFLEKFL